MLTHSLGEYTHSNTGKVIDGESSVPGVVSRKDTAKAGRENVILHAFLKFRKSKCFSQVLEQDFDENTAARGGFIFIQMNYRKNVPSDCISTQQMSKETCDVSQSVGLVSVNCVVVLSKGLFEQVSPQTIQFCESFPNEAKELGVCFLL